jgi:choline dehydrogenase-like flavoprotein
VGRFFMEHPHGRGGRVVGASAWKMLRTFQKHRFGRQEAAALLAASPELQRSRRMLNSALTVAARPPAAGDRPLITAAYLAAKQGFDPTERGRWFWKTYKSIGRRLRYVAGPAYGWARQKCGRDELAVVLRAEQAPNPDSRITLSREVDATGMPRIQLDWRLTSQDRESAAELVSAFARTMDRTGAGKVDPAEWLSDDSVNWVSDPLVSVHPLGGYHHMGTTRMADDPKRGVTDGSGRVHGVANLYVAGSSLFPTGGWANPTLTILALALRQADHLLGKAAA